MRLLFAKIEVNAKTNNGRESALPFVSNQAFSFTDSVRYKP